MFLVSNNKSNTFFTNTTIVNGKVFETFSQTIKQSLMTAQRATEINSSPKAIENINKRNQSPHHQSNTQILQIVHPIQMQKTNHKQSL